MLVHKCVSGTAPESLREKIEMSPSYKRTYNLVERKFESEYGKRAFSRAGPKLWNNLPIAIRMESDTTEFKKLLKTYLMTDAERYQSYVNMR